ncbi:MAG: hypothetical protein J2P26_09120 [Nocardiopsaceae bacterium]|nr:hypothetical protein [Nocardiopsaceae bacterium]
MTHPPAPAITLTAGQAETVLAALDDAAGARRDRAAACCECCSRYPAGACADLTRAREYDTLAGQLAGSLAGHPRLEQS